MLNVIYAWKEGKGDTTGYWKNVKIPVFVIDCCYIGRQEVHFNEWDFVNQRTAKNYSQLLIDSRK